jgi:hypothetical protein
LKQALFHDKALTTGRGSVADSDDFESVFIDIVGGDRDVYEQCAEEAMSRKVPHYGLTFEERMAIWIYSSTDARWYERINGSLWKPVGSDPKVTIFARLLNKALQRLPEFQGTVYRGYRAHDLAAFTERYIREQVILWPGFTSTSHRREKAFTGNVLFRILSKTGRLLGEYADAPSEEEVLIPSGSTFERLAVDGGGRSAFIYLRQVA